MFELAEKQKKGSLGPIYSTSILLGSHQMLVPVLSPEERVMRHNSCLQGAYNMLENPTTVRQ